MLSRFAKRLLPILQLTRMALVFTAIADSMCELFLRTARVGGGNAESFWRNFDSRAAIATAIISVGLYAYGMSLNDIIDRRRDSTIAAHRPLPSGRIGVLTAHLICVFLAITAILGGVYLCTVNTVYQWIPLVIVIWTGLLITFYDVAGKYLVWPGLICLGLIRFFHCVIPAPDMPVIWHPLLLLNHVAILSTIAYKWEEKRPALTTGQRGAVLAMLGGIDGVLILFCAKYRPESLALTPGLLLPAAAVLVFIAIALFIRWRHGNRREDGQTLMLYGLLWLIVYDAAFVAAYLPDPARWLAALILFMLLPLAYMSVQLMRWWSKLIVASQRPDYKRAGT